MKKKLFLAVGLGWIIPGAGHFYIGKRNKGIFYFFLLVITMIVGIIFSDFHIVGISDNIIYFISQTGSAVTFGIGYYLRARPPANWDISFLQYSEIGLLYFSLPGLLNLQVMLNIFDIFNKENGKEEIK